MKLLLDTHVLLWWLSNDAELGKRTSGAIADPNSIVFVSAASAWEIAIKVGLGRLELGEPPEVCLPREIERNGFRELPVTAGHALAVGSLPEHHRDPFDRMLIAQARLEQLILVTADKWIREYDVPVLDARA